MLCIAVEEIDGIEIVAFVVPTSVDECFPIPTVDEFVDEVVA